ncbi:PaaI family thioesterase [Rhodococcus sp. WS4]|nr:PaaI family thioesterase [Rhodococcus sp. WS4]
MTNSPHAPTTDETSRQLLVTWSDPREIAAGAAGKSGLDVMRALASGHIDAPPVIRLVGAQFVAADEGSAVFTLTPHESHYNPIGSVHGGIIATLLDSAAACAVHTTLDEKTAYTSLDLSLKYLRAVTIDTGVVTCTGSVTHRGRRTALATAELRDDAGRLLATATSSCLIFEHRA